MNYAQINKFDIANGPGIRTSLFTQGCDIHCIQQEIVYAYVTTEMLTNGYGGVHGHQDYICYGVQNGDNILDEEDRMDLVTMRKSEKDHSYIEYYYERRIYEDGTYYDRYDGAALYLTDDMLKNLRTSN